MHLELKVDNTKEKREYYEIPMKIRDKEHFYNIVTHMNKNVGRAGESWGSNTPINQRLMNSNGEPVDAKLRVYKNFTTMGEYDLAQMAMFLALK